MRHVLTKTSWMNEDKIEALIEANQRITTRETLVTRLNLSNFIIIRSWNDIMFHCHEKKWKLLSEQPGIFFERMDGDWKILILIRTYVFFTLGSHLLGTFVQMIQIIDLILARVVHFVEKFEIVLKITPYALHRAQIQSDRSCEIVLYGSIANPFQTFPFFLPELKIVPSRFPICRKRHVDHALLICIHIIFTCNISCCRSYTASKNSLLKIGPNSRWPVVVSWYIYIYMTSDEIVWMTIQKRERERLPYRDPQIWYKLAQFCRKVGNENQSNFSRSLLCLWVLPKSL